MNSKSKRILLLFLSIGLAVNSYFIIRVVLAEENNDSLQTSVVFSENKNILGCEDTIINQTYFIKTVGLNNPQSLIFTANEILRKKQLKDTIGVYREIIDKVFTPSIAEFDSTKSYSPSHINQIIIQGYNFANAAKYNFNESLYLNAIADMYFNNASKQMEFYQKSNIDLANEFTFKYLTQRCIEANVGIDPKESSADKFIKTLLEEDYFHLINTTWNKSSLKLKLLIGLAGMLLIIGLFNVLHFIYSKFPTNTKL